MHSRPNAGQSGGFRSPWSTAGEAERRLGRAQVADGEPQLGVEGGVLRAEAEARGGSRRSRATCGRIGPKTSCRRRWAGAFPSRVTARAYWFSTSVGGLERPPSHVDPLEEVERLSR